MNLDIEAMAREAGAIPIHKKPKDMAIVGVNNIEAYTRLIVERCAEIDFRHAVGLSHEQDSEVSAAIRNLLEPK